MKKDEESKRRAARLGAHIGDLSEGEVWEMRRRWDCFSLSDRVDEVIRRIDAYVGLPKGNPQVKERALFVKGVLEAWVAKPPERNILALYTVEYLHKQRDQLLKDLEEKGKGLEKNYVYVKPGFVLFLGRRIRKARLAKKLGQKELAGMVPVHPRTMRKYETGHRCPSFPVLRTLADALGTTAGELDGRYEDWEQALHQIKMELYRREG